MASWFSNNVVITHWWMRKWIMCIYCQPHYVLIDGQACGVGCVEIPWLRARLEMGRRHKVICLLHYSFHCGCCYKMPLRELLVTAMRASYSISRQLLSATYSISGQRSPFFFFAHFGWPRFSFFLHSLFPLLLLVVSLIWTVCHQPLWLHLTLSALLNVTVLCICFQMLLGIIVISMYLSRATLPLLLYLIWRLQSVGARQQPIFCC